MDETKRELVDGLTEFLICEVEEKVLQGISYIIIPKKESNKARIEKYDALRKAMTKAGIGENETFCRYELPNGIIYDLSLAEAVKLTEKISLSVAKKNNGKTPVGDLGIRNKAFDRHREDLERLAKKIVESAKKGVAEIEVALFSKNDGGTIVITGSDSNSKANVAVKYDAFALRHTDIEELNREFLALQGLMVTKIEAHEVLSSATGVRFILKIARTGR